MTKDIHTSTPRAPEPARRAAKRLRDRKVDLAIVIFFYVNILFITYVVDLEQLVIANPYHYTAPLWPPPFAIKIIHSYGRTFDPLLMARPVWWKATIWIDALFFGPFYIVAIYAFTTCKNWIRLPAIMYSSVMMTNVTIILSEELWGPHRTPYPIVVLGDNAAWFIFPIIIITRMWKSERPFTFASTQIGATSDE